MASKRNFSEDKTLELYQLTLVNARNSKDIAENLAELGYNSKKLETGDQLFAKTCNALNKSRSEKDKLKVAYIEFLNLKESLLNSYSIHRKLAKVAFRKDEAKAKAEKLALNKTAPKAYSKWFTLISKFYREAAEDQEIVKGLSEFNLNEKVISSELEKIRKLDIARAQYIKKKGQSQRATDKKNAAFDEIYQWMKDFYTVAKIAFRENPAMIVAFGKVVRR